MQPDAPRAPTPPASRRVPLARRVIPWLRAAPGRFGWLAAAGVVLAAALWGTYQFVEPAPPDSLTVATGEPDGAYHAEARRLAEVFAAEGIRLELLPSEGSVDNLAKLAAGEADVAFVQSGLVSAAAARGEAEGAPADALPVVRGLEGLASVYFEPVWVFVRAEVRPTRLDALAGSRIAVGRRGSGTRPVAVRLLAESGVGPEDAEFLELGTEAAAAALAAGEIDAAFVISSPDAPAVRRLLADPDVLLTDLERAAGWSRRHAWLKNLLLPAGTLDFARDLPPVDVRLLGVAATLVAREDLHPALADLTMRAAGETFDRDTLFSNAGRFPSPDYLDLPPSDEATRYFRYGVPFLQRYLPFWAATLVDRLKLLALPLLALLLPLSRLLPPTWRWTVRKRVFRWYAEVQTCDLSAREDPSAENLRACLAALGRIEDETRGLEVPLGYAHELYALRLHVELLAGQIRRRLAGDGAAGAAPTERDDASPPGVPPPVSA